MKDPVADAAEDLWVFGYGSLMWRPGFMFEESSIARLDGLHRSLCVYSFVHRGSRETPGLVLGLDQGGSCRGIAFRVAAERRRETVEYLRSREQVTSVYVEVMSPVRLADGRRPLALAYRVDRHHEQFAGRLTDDRILALVRQGRGVSGANPDYVIATADHLASLRVRDQRLERLAAILRAERVS